jgi:signal transduction histidine kinase
LHGPRWLETLHPDDARRGALVWAEAVRSGEPYEAEYRFRRHDGAWRWHAVRGLPVRDESGTIGRWVGTCIDIHERRVLEEDLHARVSAAVAEREEALARLHEAQKLETIGQLTGGVAHDFNNLLTPIVGSLDMLQRRGLPDDRSQRMISGALQAAESARLLVQRLLAFARRQHLETRAVEVGALVRGMQDLIERSIGPTVAVTVHAPEDLLPAQVDANQLELAILNLALNARDAMPDGGTLAIAVSMAARPAGLAPGRYVRLAVTDTGEGMDAETLKRCIEPFFTSKETGRGTGLGLSMVHGLAAQFGGALRLTSAPGEGTTAELWLPVATEVAHDAAAPAEPTAAGGARLLLVDDDTGVREATAEMLRDAGYAVQLADSAESAIAMLEGGLAVDALVTDHLMPGITGAQLVRRLRVTRPEIAALVITGYSRADEIGDDFARLPKPFRQVELTAAIEQALKRITA